jgi:hypothetical protein
MARADVDGLSTRAVTELSPVRFATVPSAEGLVVQHKALVHVEARDRKKEPLALTPVGGVLAAVASFCSELSKILSDLHLDWLESLLCL